MVDLHSHSNRSDGNLDPNELIDLARRKGLQALAMTDHDTVQGYFDAVPYASKVGVDLICGVELNTRFHDRSIHILGYFLEKPPDETFQSHLSCLQKARRERNVRLAKRLQQLGLNVHSEEAERLGRGQTGRPHFAQLLVDKGYVSTVKEAFDCYLDESAPGYVERRDPSPENVFRWIREAGGVSSWAHPGRFTRKTALDVEQLFAELAARGLNAIEVYHSDHIDQETESFRSLAKRLGLGITGGSDFHGGDKSRAQLGCMNLPCSLLEDLLALSEALISNVS